MAAGAGTHLSNTRILIVEAELTPEEPNARYKNSMKERLNAFTEILALMPKDSLTSFRLASLPLLFCVRSDIVASYISSRPLPMEVFEEVFKDQKSIAHIQGPIDCGASNVSPMIEKILSDMQSLDLQEENARSFGNTMLIAANSGHTMECLSLNVFFKTDGNKSVIPSGNSHPISFPKLKDIRLEGVTMTDILEPSSRLLTFSNLVRLTMYDCHGVGEAFGELAQRVDGANIALKHLAIYASDLAGAADYNEHVVQQFLIALVRNLSSLHTSWTYVDSLAEFLANNAHQAPNLQSLGIHDYSDDLVAEELWAESSIQFRTICENCPKLKSIGYRIPEYTLHPKEQTGANSELDSFEVDLLP